ncbi:MAG: bis(5'-nucleosyl)-tetraphosphatase (symmetrical) YqeK [Clostridia bacterium]|nr:bis(5'-nucleosyl)-tetraphosphatase (symmetrical) YqeK [Clostridia bacterium]
MAKERIGILGAAFDPFHQGHLQMARAALDSGRVDRLLVIPSADEAYKPCIAGREDRWKMAVTGCTQDDRLIPSRLEIDRPGPAYTVDTLLALKREYPKAELFCLLGADGAMKLRGWRRLPEVLRLCSFLVCPRVGKISPGDFHRELADLTALGGRFLMLTMEPLTVSSSGIRDQLSAGGSVQGLSYPLREFIALKGLYGTAPRMARAGEWIEKLFAALNPRRFAHSLSVAAYSRHLARLYGVDPRQAEEAGLLHDCAKCLPMKDMRRIAAAHSLTDDPTVLESNALLHSLVGAQVARDEYGMEDPAVLEAIAYHNTGRAGMSRLAMCVCLADSIEPTRPGYPLLDQVRVLSELSLERALLLSLEGTSAYVRQRGKYLHPRTQETIDWLKSLPETRSAGK